MKVYRSNGKLLLTSEYLVLDGATALAIPTKFGQSLKVKDSSEKKITWKSLDHNNSIWFETEFELKDFFNNSFRSESDIENKLFKILSEANNLNPIFLNGADGFEITTHLDFPRDWGLGSSSTLINNIAQWAVVSPYQLLNNTFGGSGYDIACASSNSPLLYKLNEEKPWICEVNFNPAFKSSLYFIHLNKKQNSRAGIEAYRLRQFNRETAIETANSLSSLIFESQTLDEFSTHIEAHENLIANILGLAKVKHKYFNDFKGTIKSLGAWGGDFILAISEENPKKYFNDKGYHTILNYNDMILNS